MLVVRPWANDIEITPATEPLHVGAAAIFMSGGGPRNGQEAARVELYPRSRRAARAAGAPALVSLLRGRPPLSSVASRVSWESLELDMPHPWRRVLGGSAKDLFTKQADERRRCRSRSRSPLSCAGHGGDGDGSGGEGNGGVDGGGGRAGGGGGSGGGDSGGGKGGGGPRNSQEAARVEVYPRSGRAARAAGAPALVSLLRSRPL